LRDLETIYRRLIEQVPAVTYIQEIGSPEPAMYMSPQIESLTGYTPEDCKNPELRWRMVHPEDRRQQQSEDERVVRPGESFASEYRVIHRDGHTVWVQNQAIVVEEGGTLCWQGFMLDITERKQAEESLRRSESNLADAQRIARLGSWEWDLNTGEVWWSDEAYRICGFAPRQFAPTFETVAELLHPDDRHLFTQIIDYASPAKAIQDFEHRIVRPDGEVRWVHRRGEVVHSESRQALRMIGTIHDITERKALEERLAYRASHDPLTGMLNRQALQDHLESVLDEKHRSGELLAILFLDLDNFKVVNDSLGHAVGDQLLVSVSLRLKQCMRSEIVAARLGGDEFIIVLEGISDTSEAEGVARRILRRLSEPFTLEGHRVFVTASIGIALNVSDDVTSAYLLQTADIALYRAKDGLKAYYAVFDPDKDAHALERLVLENELRGAIERNELRVYYQPVFSLETSDIVGMEALMRWEHPERGMMSPDEFIPLAEETGLIVSLGQWVLERACSQAREWQERYPREPQPIMGVNLSLRQLQSPNLVEEVARILRESELDPEYLALEITESVAMYDEDSTAATLESLKSLGVWLVIDDFGSGNSSVSYLTSRFKMEHLKIAGSFICELSEDAENQPVLQGLIDFAHTVGLRVIAEGVESADHLKILKGMGCEFVQGYYMSRPFPPTAAAEVLTKAFPSAAEGGRP
jgi:diguanylate cyclase (GGDEF)-like protein/PAS domain S-box-containing protein